MTEKSGNFSLPKSVTIHEQIVAEGFQAWEEFIPTKAKVFLVERMVDAGFKSICVGSFSHPEAQPQHRDCEEVYKMIPKKDDVAYITPTPNMRALERAIKCRENGGAGPTTIVALIGATEAYNQTLMGTTTDEQLKRCGQILDAGRKAGFKVNLALVGTWYCLITGKRIDRKLSYELADKVMAMEPDELSYGEGSEGPEAPTPLDAYEFFSRMLDKYPDPGKHSLHYHDKLGFGTALFFAAMQGGLAKFDTTFGGLSGYMSNIVDKVPTRGATEPLFDNYISPGHYGQVPTEDFVVMCENMGISTGIDVDKMFFIGIWLEKIAGQKLGSFVLKNRIGTMPTPFSQKA
jgi:hydroxymethylglutaryl-CoA lyase